MLAGDVDYEHGGQGYASSRRTDPSIAVAVHEALGTGARVLNVGAGAGSYEPPGRRVVALEPSATMRAQRPPHAGPAVEGVAERLPFGAGAFDAAMAIVTVHQWRDAAAGLREMRRVARGPVVVLTFDGTALGRFWLADYVPELISAEHRRYPALEAIGHALGPGAEFRTVPVPNDCRDGFTEAFFGRPEAFLDPAVRGAQSAWRFVEASVEERFVRTLRADLGSGAWDRRYGSLRQQQWFEGSLRMVVHAP